MNSEENKNTIAAREEKILEFWRDNDIFQKSLEKNKGKERFVFYDGPPFATGLPHYGHLLAGSIKDVIPRYQSMRGKYVRRKWGWDCHGLPIENLIEAELNLKEKKDIEKLGVDTFNEAARGSVLRYDEKWKEIVPRMGRWIDMEDAYKTMDWQYTESIWWAFKTLFDKGLIYEGYKSMHICPRCETTLAISEVTQGYKDITDISVYAKFELVEESNTYFLAWTTTPWTLPGNVALAVGNDVDYVKIRIKNQELGLSADEAGIKNQYILAKDRVGDVIKDEYEIVEELKGKDLIGISYKPIFDYYSYDEKLSNRENGWRVYVADFVDTESGTGIVHIAPAFGEDDMDLGRARNLPFIQHVGMDGRFKKEVTDFAGARVKPKDNHQEADISIIKNLAARGLLFAKEKIIHSYPHCWRCETPLLNYAAGSWFVKVTAIKETLLSLNEKIRWVPEYVGKARFGNWLAEARDWAISRARYWGAPIPVWKCEKCARADVIGSIKTLREKTKKQKQNNFFVMRHGQAEHNIKNIISSNPDAPHSLTEQGIREVKETADSLKKEKIDFIFSSPFVRARETADIVAETLNLSGANIIIDARLREVDTGDLDGRPVEEYRRYFSSHEEKFFKPTPNGDTLRDMKNRLADFLYEIDDRYSGKNILFVTHEYGAWLLFAASLGAGPKEAALMKGEKDPDLIKTGEVMPLLFSLFPHDKNYEIDLHRPYIDDIKISCSCGGEMRRVPEVFDCWFESGSMPYAQFHYMGEKETKEGKLFFDNFPADFIAEGLDQTRGWFYNMLVLSAGLFGKEAYKNVVVNGLVLAEDGQKMSKRLKNYPDPIMIANTYGADALRYYLLSSPAVRAEPLNFSERGVGDVYKKVLGRLFNVVSFYELYPAEKENMESAHVLDVWIMERLAELTHVVSAGFETYELDKATRFIGEFVDDVSTWYVRRSRERLKEGDEAGREALQRVLLEFSKIIAPIMPFAAEDIYKRMKGKKESVHLEEWPALESRIRNQESGIIDEMNEVRKIVSLGLEARAEAKIKVRQPLLELRIKPALSADKNQELGIKNDKQLLQLIKDEVNVKDIVFDDSIKSDVYIDTNITSELEKEGIAREFIRQAQDIRKKKNLSPISDITLIVETGDDGKEIINAYDDTIKKILRARKIMFESAPDGVDISVNDISFRVGVRSV